MLHKYVPANTRRNNLHKSGVSMRMANICVARFLCMPLRGYMGNYFGMHFDIRIYVYVYVYMSVSVYVCIHAIKLCMYACI